MAGTTTAMCGSFKAQLALSAHCFSAPLTSVAFTTANASTAASAGTTAGLYLGMPVTGANIAANTVVAQIVSGTAFTLSIAATGTNPGGLSFAGDAFKIALIKVSPTGTYGASSTNYSNITGNSDEVTNAAGAAYTAGGQALATNITPSNTAGNAFWQWSANPSWTSASFSTTGAMIYNTSNRGAGAGAAVSVHDFGGTQTVTAGTFTLLQPSNAASTSLLQLN